jgi:hypothetical protein
MVLIVMMRERQLLLAMRGIIGVVAIEDNSDRRLGVAGNEVVHEGLCEPREVFAVHLMLQTGEGGGTRQVLLRIQGGTLHPEFAHGVTAEMIGVIGIGISRGDLINALGQQIPQGMVNRGGVPLIVESGGEALREAYLLVDTPQQEGTKVR